MPPPNCPSKNPIGNLLLTFFFLVAVAPRPAYASVACSAQDFACPAPPALCVLTGTWDIPDDCVLDFGTQDLEIQGTLRAETIRGDFDVRAPNIRLNGGRLLSRGNLDDFGGRIRVLATGDVLLDGGGATIDVSGNGGGGDIDINAARVTLEGGNLIADGGVGEDNCGDAGDVTITAVGHVLINGATSGVRASTGGYHCSGGEISILGGSVEIRKSIDVSGGSPYGVEITALTGDLLVPEGGPGIKADGRGSFEESGNDGGSITLEAVAGNVVVSSQLSARGSGLDGWGSDIEIFARLGQITLDDVVDAGAPGSDTFGGAIDIAGADGLILDGMLRAIANGQSGGGDITVEVTGPIAIGSSGEISVDGGASGAGRVTLEAESAVTIDGDVRATGSGGGPGGSIDVSGCEILVGGTVDAGASGGGDGLFNTLEAVRIGILAGASIRALPCPTSDCNQFTLRSGTALIDPSATIQPSPTQATNATLNTCCGNGRTDDGTAGTPDAGEQCDDGNFAFCDGCTPSCTSEPVGGCPPDGNECTLDCNPAAGCTYAPQTGTPCGDEPNACTEDICSAGTCLHVPLSCDDGIACTVDSCDSIGGCIATPDDAVCADGEICTTDRCDTLLGCTQDPVPDGQECDDGDLCTTNDSCQGGTCTGPAPECDDGDACTIDTCVPTIGCIGLEDAAACDCLDDLGLPLSEGTSCRDGFGCTIGDTCDAAGACTPGPSCPDSDGDACTVESCTLGICTVADTGCLACEEGEPCSDGDACTTGICTGGVCVSSPLSCDDGLACTTDQCVPSFGCRVTDFAGEASCIDQPLRAFGCYKARLDKSAGGSIAPLEGTPLEDEFWGIDVDSKSVREFCTPIDPGGLDPLAPSDPDSLVSVKIKPAAGSPKFTKRSNLEVTNAMGTLRVDARSLQTVMVPTAMSAVSPPGPPALPNPDAFACYKVSPASGAPKFTPLSDLVVEDTFGSLTVDLKKPSMLCNPANLNDTDPAAPSNPGHLLCYKARTKTPFLARRGLLIDNVLGTATLDAIRLTQICLPSEVSPPEALP